MPKFSNVITLKRINFWYFSLSQRFIIHPVIGVVATNPNFLLPKTQQILFLLSYYAEAA